MENSAIQQHFKMLVLTQIIIMNKLEGNNISESKIDQDVFLNFLKSQKIEEAIDMYMSKNIEIAYNNRQRFIPKQTWIKYLRKTILNKFTEVVQFKIEKSSSLNDVSNFKIYMICKKINGTLDFTEIAVQNNWEGHYINKMEYQLINH